VGILVGGTGSYRVLATLLAMVGVALTVGAYRFFFGRFPSAPELLDLGLVLVFFTGVFSFVVFGLLESQQKKLHVAYDELQRQRDILQGLWDATGVVATLPDLGGVLQQIVDLSRTLFGAEYAALAVLSDEDPSKIRQFITSGLSDEERRRIGQLPTGKGLLGKVIREKRPLRIQHIPEHPDSAGFPPHHPAMDSFLGLPLLYRGTVVGHLYMTNKPGGFTPQDEMLAQLFGRQAAVVISNARLYREREMLATAQERERIGRELHDGVLQTLYGLTLSLDSLLDTEPDLSPTAQKELSRITEVLSLTMTDIRMYIQTLAQSDVDLRVALVDMLQRGGGMQDIVLEFRDNQYLELDPEVVHDIVMSVQEAVSNARRHGEASRIVVGWEALEDWYRVWIQDNGRGFDPAEVSTDHHFGLRNMRRRMEHWQARMTVESRPGSGTTVTFWFPRDDMGNTVEVKEDIQHG